MFNHPTPAAQINARDMVPQREGGKEVMVHGDRDALNLSPFCSPICCDSTLCQGSTCLLHQHNRHATKFTSGARPLHLEYKTHYDSTTLNILIWFPTLPSPNHSGCQKLRKYHYACSRPD